MKTSLSLMSLAILSLLVLPGGLTAQCEGCRNDPDGGQSCTSINPDTPMLWNDCYVYWTFCQLSDPCDEEEEEAPTLAMSPDSDITPAGTFRPVFAPVVVGHRTESIVTCKGFVVVSADPLANRPETIVLDSN